MQCTATRHLVHFMHPTAVTIMQHHLLAVTLLALTASTSVFADGPFEDPATAITTDNPEDGIYESLVNKAKEIRKRLDAKVNDVVLSVVAGAVRDFLEMRGVPIDGLDFRLTRASYAYEYLALIVTYAIETAVYVESASPSPGRSRWRPASRPWRRWCCSPASCGSPGGRDASRRRSSSRCSRASRTRCRR